MGKVKKLSLNKRLLTKLANAYALLALIAGVLGYAFGIVFIAGGGIVIILSFATSQPNYLPSGAGLVVLGSGLAAAVNYGSKSIADSTIRKLLSLP